MINVNLLVWIEYRMLNTLQQQEIMGKCLVVNWLLMSVLGAPTLLRVCIF